MPPRLVQVVRHHLGAHLARGDLRHPAELLAGLGGVAQQRNTQLGGASLHELAHAV